MAVRPVRGRASAGAAAVDSVACYAVIRQSSTIGPLSPPNKEDSRVLSPIGESQENWPAEASDADSSACRSKIRTEP